MKALLANLFKRRAETAPASVAAPALAPKPARSKRRYGKNKRRLHAPKGARRIDSNGPLIEQARQAAGIKR